MSSLTIQCFGILEQACGGPERTLDVADFPIRVGDALARFAVAVPAVNDYLPYVACAVGDEIVLRDHPLNADDTLVLLPPVSGG